MENNTLKASIGIDFSLIGTQLHAMYEKNEGGYAVLLIPSEQTPDNGISVKDLIDDIKKMAKGVSGSDTAVDTTQLETAMTEAAKEGGGSTSMKLEDIVIRLQMAYLYICKKGENSVLEYAFQLQVVTEGLVPETIKLCGCDQPFHFCLEYGQKEGSGQDGLITVDEYLGVAALPDKSQAAK